MPEEINETAPPKPKALIHPKELSAEYHKAHKQLMLWATILFIWELVGVNLDKAKDAGGNIGPVVTALKSPQAVPWVLLIFVVYFLFKCSVEWAQCHIERRKLRFARIDFLSAWLVSMTSIALYIGQAVGKVQFADFLKEPSAKFSIAFGIITGISINGAAFFIWRTTHISSGKLLRLLMAASFPLVTTIFYISERGRGPVLIWRATLLGVAIGFAYGGLVYIFVGRAFIKSIIVRTWRFASSKL